MKTQATTQTLDRELLNLGLTNELFFDETAGIESDLYEVEGYEEYFNEMSYSDFAELINDEIEEDDAPLYYKSVPNENTGSHLNPLGA